ncbi:hypothetical protein MMC20_004938 [Loxospora ochrophaea]|nr:hypothetical protein [Loxospora ochrophaea]
MDSAADDCNDCTPAYLQNKAPLSIAVVFSALPFFATFVLVATVVFQRLFPLLSGESVVDGLNESQVFRATFNSRRFSESSSTQQRSPVIRLFSALTFSTTVALAAVLAELILCEISNTVNPAARGLALHTTVLLLLFSLIVAIPSLELHSIISAAGWKYTGQAKGRLRLAWVLQATGFMLWICGFWWSGHTLLDKHSQNKIIDSPGRLIDGCLERVGVIGISLMALLSGFAAVSSPWQNFCARPRPVTEIDISRKQAGLSATNDMLSAKRSRLRALDRKISSNPSESFFQKAIGSIRGNADQTERKTLQVEISGLETMSVSLSTSLSLLQSHLSQQRRSRTPLGRLLLSISYAFSIYCVYRILTTTLTFTRRLLASPSQPFTGSDPIHNILALLVNHYDSDLDQAAWTRQISFLLSGLILFASFSSVLQTLHFFARFTPNLLKAAQANLALIVAQICATYVISSALLLRGMMPGETGVKEGLKDLGGGEMGWVDGWFEVWFLGGVFVTGAAVWVGRKVAGEEWDDEADVEMGKRS